MTIYDISLAISPTLPVWPGDPHVTLELVSSMDRGDEVNVTQLSMSAHTGTHVDAPHHFLNDQRTVDALALEVLTGPCQVIHLSDAVDVINAAVLDRINLPSGATRLLFATRNSQLWGKNGTIFEKDFVAVSPDGAEWLVRHGIRLVGVDYLSVAPFSDSFPTHTILLKAGVVIVEGLQLSQVSDGAYQLYCLPLKLLGADGAPARAILID
jgi:arylformamidase